MLGTAQKSPDAFRTISEVAEGLDVPQHVLRFWETKFAPVKPLKRGGGRRYYRPDDIDLLRGIRSLLYSDGLTIKGVQKILREQGPRYVIELGRSASGLMESVRAANLAASSTPSSESKAEQASNVRRFPREAVARVEGNGAEPATVQLTGGQRARFMTLMDELVEMKAKLNAARSRAG